MAGHVRQIHVADLLSNLLAPFISRGFQVDVEIANKQGSGPAWAVTPCCSDVIQRGSVEGWDVTPHDVVLISPRYQLKRHHVGAVEPCLLNLVRVALPPN